MKLTAAKTLPKFALAALFAAGTTAAVVATEAANPAPSGIAATGLLASASAPASAEPNWRDHPRGYGWHGRHYVHRRWHAGFWDGYHHWHPGFFVYF
jgi:hypothetical protein